MSWETTYFLNYTNYEIIMKLYQLDLYISSTSTSTGRSYDGSCVCTVQCTTGGAVFIVSSSEPISKKEIPGTVPVPYNSEDGICLVCKCKSGTVHM